MVVRELTIIRSVTTATLVINHCRYIRTKPPVLPVGRHSALGPLYHVTYTCTCDVTILPGCADFYPPRKRRNVARRKIRERPSARISAALICFVICMASSRRGHRGVARRRETGHNGTIKAQKDARKRVPGVDESCHARKL